VVTPVRPGDFSPELPPMIHPSTPSAKAGFPRPGLERVIASAGAQLPDLVASLCPVRDSDAEEQQS
jgi:hypothetical protein